MPDLFLSLQCMEPPLVQRRNSIYVFWRQKGSPLPSWRYKSSLAPEWLTTMSTVCEQSVYHPYLMSPRWGGIFNMLSWHECDKDLKITKKYNHRSLSEQGISVFSPHTHTHKHTYHHIRKYTFIYIQTQQSQMHTHIHICAHSCTHTYHTQTYMYICAHLFTYIYTLI